VSSKGDDIVPIPGTKRPAYLEENVGALDVELSAEQVEALDQAVSPGSVRGGRYADRDMTLLNN
jgi:aryl-alcohol dehydrogenase-like predicted oxidoreductase